MAEDTRPWEERIELGFIPAPLQELDISEDLKEKVSEADLKVARLLAYEGHSTSSLNTVRSWEELKDDKRNASERRQELPVVPDTPLDVRYRQELLSTVCHIQLHRHSATCYKYRDYSKYLKKKRRKGKKSKKPKEPPCRFYLPEHLIRCSYVEPETCLFYIRRHHAYINSFNTIFSFLLRCNHDIKFIGQTTGQSYAIVSYITNYLAKFDVSFYNMLTLLTLSLKREQERRQKQKGKTDESRRARAARVIRGFHNYLARRVQLSGAQVAMYLMDLADDGDRYVSHRFRSLSIHDFLSLLREEETRGSEADMESDEDGEPTTAEPEKQDEGINFAMYFDKGSGKAVLAAPMDDYLYRAVDDVTVLIPPGTRNTPCHGQEAIEGLLERTRMNEIYLYQFFELFTREKGQFGDSNEPTTPTEDRVGRIQRFPFASTHSLSSSHHLRQVPYGEELVPVLVSNPFLPSRHAKKPEDREAFARIMLVLFKPFYLDARHPESRSVLAQLRGMDETFSAHSRSRQTCRLCDSPVLFPQRVTLKKIPSSLLRLSFSF